MCLHGTENEGGAREGDRRGREMVGGGGEGGRGEVEMHVNILFVLLLVLAFSQLNKLTANKSTFSKHIVVF